MRSAAGRPDFFHFFSGVSSMAGMKECDPAEALKKTSRAPRDQCASTKSALLPGTHALWFRRSTTCYNGLLADAA